MDDFGPKRPMSEDAPCASEGVEKAKRSRPKKKPDYDRDKEIEAFQARAVELFGEPHQISEHMDGLPLFRGLTHFHLAFSRIKRYTEYAITTE